VPAQECRGNLERRRAGIEEDRFGLPDERCGEATDRQSRTPVLVSLQHVRDVSLAVGRTRERAAAGAPGKATRFEIAQVAPDGRAVGTERGAQLRDLDEVAFLEQLDDSGLALSW
jgi:hypothetical protein